MNTKATYFVQLGRKISSEREKLRYTRDENGSVILHHSGSPMTQEIFLEYMEQSGRYLCSRSQLSQIENGVEKAINSLSLSKWLDLCSVFNCELAHLLGEQECKTRDTQFIHDQTGLSEIAIRKLADIHQAETFFENLKPEGLIDSLSIMIEDERFGNLLETLVQRFTVKETSETLEPGCYSGAEALRAIKILHDHQATVTFPDGYKTTVEPAELLDGRISNILLRRIPHMKAAFRNRYQNNPDLQNNADYVSLSHLLGETLGGLFQPDQK